MPVLFIYMLKFSISLSIVYMFYHLVLRRLTFYNSNRWYLIGYTLLSFLIPFINITPVLENNKFSQSGILQLIPAVEKYTSPSENAATYSFFTTFADWNKWDWISFALLAGAGLFLLRFIVRCISFFNMRSKAQLLSVDGMKLYQVSKNIIPFSFGNSVFINSDLHTEEELQEIIRHEFVHVKQKHTLDIIWSEWLCIINWYNPFAWLLKTSIRQNLEFIADNKVLQNGVDRKQYQYLLLKVIGNNHFSIAPKFNFSSLKKRIAMMNKLKSAKLHLVKFLFVLPLLAVLLLAFRGRWKESGKSDTTERKVNIAGLVVDVATKKPLAGAIIFSKGKNITVQTNEKGYYFLSIPYENKPLQFSLFVVKKGYAPFHQQENWGNFYEEHILSLYGNTFEFFGLVREGDGKGGFSALSGKDIAIDDLNYEEALKHFENALKRSDDNQQDYTDTIPAKNEPNEKGYIINIKDNNGNCTIVIKDKNGKEVERLLLTKWNENEKYFEDKYGEIPPPPPPPAPIPPKPPVPPTPMNLPANVKSINVNNDKATVHLQNGTKENYDLSIPDQKAAFEKKYGELLEPPTPPTAPKAPVKIVGVDGTDNLSTLADEFEITNKKAVIHLRNGKTEEYDLTNSDSRRKFEKKYGKIINTNVNANVSTNVDASSNVSVNSHVNTSSGVNTAVSPVAIVNHGSGRTVIAHMYPVAEVEENVLAVDPFGHTITGEEDILLTITKKTTADQLEVFKKQMKEKGIGLKFDEIDYDNGKLVKISGTMKSKDGQSKSTFSATDFNKLILATIKDGSKTYFKVSITDNKVVI